MLAQFPLLSSWDRSFVFGTLPLYHTLWVNLNLGHTFWITHNYRQGYNLFAVNGILFNHESVRRGETFVTRKITCALAAILAGRQQRLYLSNLDAKRDWGYAPEYVEVMWLMLQQDQPNEYDFVIGTGEAHTVRKFLDEAFGYVGLDWNNYVQTDPATCTPPRWTIYWPMLPRLNRC